MGSSSHQNNLFHGEGKIIPVFLGHNGHLPGYFLGSNWLCPDFLKGLFQMGLQSPADRSRKVDLAGPVGPDDAQQLTGGDGERHLI